MTTYFFDTSALVKRYLTETGSRWTRQIVAARSNNVIVVSDLAAVEFFSVLVRQRHAGSLPVSHVKHFQTGFLRHVKREYITVPLDGAVLTHARDLVMKHRLRPPDAIQLASAIFAMNFLNEPSPLFARI